METLLSIKYSNLQEIIIAINHYLWNSKLV